MHLDELDRWLDTYGRAWEQMDADGFVGCFAEDASYHWGPWEKPFVGHDAIRGAFDYAVARQDNVRFGHELLAITPDGRGLARWWVSMQIPSEGTVEEDEGVFLVTLDADGLCTDFREWWNSRSLPASQT